MILPLAIAPYAVYLASLNVDDDEVVSKADQLYEDLTAAGVEVLYDDRDEKPGVKFNDADLIGLPLRVVVSRRGLGNGEIELKGRTEEKATYVPISDALGEIQARLK